jgi:hypothetical protein
MTPPTKKIGFKRFWGSLLIADAILLGFFVAICRVLWPQINMEPVIKVLEISCCTGGGLLGINIVEYLAPYMSKNKNE